MQNSHKDKLKAKLDKDLDVGAKASVSDLIGNSLTKSQKENINKELDEYIEIINKEEELKENGKKYIIEKSYIPNHFKDKEEEEEAIENRKIKRIK